MYVHVKAKHFFPNRPIKKYQYHVLPQIQAIVVQGGSITSFIVSIFISLNQIPLVKVGNYLECDTYIANVAIIM